MLQDFLTTLLLLSLRDRLFVLIAVATAILFLTAIAAALGIVLFHSYNERRERRWSERAKVLDRLILEVLACNESPESLWAAVRPADRVPFVESLLQNYAYNLRGEELEVVRELAEPYLAAVVKRIRSSRPEIRANAIQSVANLGLSEYETLVIQALGDPSPMVALVAARALAASGGARYARDILERLDRFELWSADFLATMIASMGSGAVPALAEKYLDTSAVPEVRAICAEALHQIHAPEMAGLAVEVLDQLEPFVVAGDLVDPDADLTSLPETLGEEVTAFGKERELFIDSLKILGSVGGSEHLPLIRRLSRSSDPVVRAIAVSALGQIGDDTDVPRLVRAMDDPSRWVAVRAAWSLKSLRAFTELERIAEGPTDRADLATEVVSSVGGWR